MPGTQAAKVYGKTETTELFACNYGLNESFHHQIASKDLIVSGLDEEETVRMVELKGHPFFISTLFVPQSISTPEKPHPIQKAYVEEQVHQCGYCINGWIMTAAAFLDESKRQNKKPTEADIKNALTGLKCRCGTHMNIMRAVKRAADSMMG